MKKESIKELLNERKLKATVHKLITNITLRKYESKWGKSGEKVA